MISKTTFAGNGTLAPAPARRRELGRLLRFVAVGGTSVAVDLLAYQLLSAWLSPTGAKTLSYVAGMLVGFVGNKFWTFESKRKSLTEPALYVSLYAATLAVNVGVNAGVLAVAGADAKLFAFLSATGVTTVLNYLGMKFVAFRRGVSEADRKGRGKG